MVVLGMLIERVVLRPLVNQPQITLFMATIGLTFVLEGLSQLIWGSQPHGLELGIPDVPMAPFKLACRNPSRRLFWLEATPV
jgi:branched-chain amino acid transport system permease protein